MKTWRLVLVMLSALPVAACGGGETASNELTLPSFDDPALVTGKSVWMNTCRACHLKGIAGAPSVFDGAAWSPRMEKGTSDLYQSALRGIPAEAGWKMPPRGGNPRLSDDQLRRAVDYMLAVVARKTGTDVTSPSSGAGQIQAGQD